jgi:hypothetical protein
VQRYEYGWTYEREQKEYVAMVKGDRVAVLSCEAGDPEFGVFPRQLHEPSVGGVLP